MCMFNLIYINYTLHQTKHCQKILEESDALCFPFSIVHYELPLCPKLCLLGIFTTICNLEEDNLIFLFYSPCWKNPLKPFFTIHQWLKGLSSSPSIDLTFALKRKSNVFKTCGDHLRTSSKTLQNYFF